VGAKRDQAWDVVAAMVKETREGPDDASHRSRNGAAGTRVIVMVGRGIRRSSGEGQGPHQRLSAKAKLQAIYTSGEWWMPGRSGMSYGPSAWHRGRTGGDVRFGRILKGRSAKPTSGATADGSFEMVDQNLKTRHRAWASSSPSSLAWLGAGGRGSSSDLRQDPSGQSTMMGRRRTVSQGIGR